MIIRGDKSIPLYRCDSCNPARLFSFWRCIGLILSIPLCRRVVDAEAPVAIVIPARGSSISMNLRENDLSWNDFLGKARNLRYSHSTLLLHWLKI